MTKKKETSRKRTSFTPKPETYQASKESAYGDDKAICKNAKCKLRKASCVGFTGCPGFKA